ncbi:MAG: SLOG family protein, partial [Candidatus Ornithomonoglobus sp.]
MEKQSICFTGHRDIKPTTHLKQLLYTTLESLIKQGAVNFYAGGALGWDTLCSLTVLRLRKYYPHIRLCLILPCHEKAQTSKWNSEQKELYYKILSAADSVEYTSKDYWNGCMKKRNARLIELADCCICYYKIRRSGTGQTV